MVYLTDELWFPDPSLAGPEGLLAIGGDLSSERLVLAYRSGIFPWFESGEPILWWSPDPRMVLFPDRLKISRSLAKTIRKAQFKVTVNACFEEVISHCAQIKRRGQRGTWIGPKMIEAYVQLHAIGYAHSVEVWKDKELVGGLYGIDLPEYKIFCGESMFSKVTDASKVGFVFWVYTLLRKKYRLIDCQMYTDHLASLGGEEIPRDTFLSFLQ